MRNNGRDGLADDLDISYYLARYESFIGRGNAQNDQYFTRRAQHSHSITVEGALRQAYLTVGTRAAELSDPGAIHFVKHGIGRRLNMILVSYAEILSIVPPARVEPLSPKDVGLISRDLNTIYINLRGVLDNYAWCLFYEVMQEKQSRINKMDVDLFSSRFMSHAAVADIKRELDHYRRWNREMKERRDPAAHRIPLYMPPAILSQEEAVRYQKLLELAAEAMADSKFDDADMYWDEAERLGAFAPYFLHNPDEERYPVYPTVPQDLGNLVKVSSIVTHFLTHRPP